MCLLNCILELCPWATLRIIRRNSPEKLITLFTVRILLRILFSALPSVYIRRTPRRNVSSGSVLRIVFFFLVSGFWSQGHWELQKWLFSSVHWRLENTEPFRAHLYDWYKISQLFCSDLTTVFFFLFSYVNFLHQDVYIYLNFDFVTWILWTSKFFIGKRQWA